jgi:hypothetical protein
MQSLRSKAHIEKKRKKRKKVLLFVPVALVLVLGFFGYYAFASRFHVTEVIVSGASFTKKEEVQTKVQQILSEKLWGFIPRRSPLLIGNRYVEEVVRTTFPPVEEVEIGIRDNALFVDIEERSAISVVCSDSKLCYFMDSQGFVFAEAPQFEGSSFIKINTFESRIEKGKQLVTKEEFDRIVEEIAVFKQHGIAIQEINFTSLEEMSLVGPHETKFIVLRSDAPQLIGERLKALLTSKPDIAQGSYEYIDMRIDSKIFLKNKES